MTNYPRSLENPLHQKILKVNKLPTSPIKECGYTEGQWVPFSLKFPLILVRNYKMEWAILMSSNWNIYLGPPLKVVHFVHSGHFSWSDRSVPFHLKMLLSLLLLFCILLSSTITKCTVGSVQLECTIPLGMWNFLNFKPLRIFVEWKAPNEKELLTFCHIFLTKFSHFRVMNFNWKGIEQF